MTKLFHDKTCWIIALACVLPVYGQKDQDMVRWVMKDNIRKDPPESLSVYVDVATVQPDVERGIVFTLNIENNGSQAVQILDPVDMLKARLFRFERPGAINLRNTKPDYTTCKLDTFREQQLKEMHDNKVARRPFQAFYSEDALRHRHMKTVSDIVPWKLDRNIERGKAPLSKSERFQAMKEGKLTLEPGEHFQAVLQIIRIVSNPSIPERTIDPSTGFLVSRRNPRPQNPIITSIMPDTYSLRLYLTLWTDIEGADIWLASSNRINIQLGEQNNEGQQNAHDAP